MTQDPPHQVFVSYSPVDRPWVEGQLLPRLEGAGLRLIDQGRFALGRPRLQEIERAVQESRRTLLVLTPAYMADTWRQFESLVAGSYGLDVGEWCALGEFQNARRAFQRAGHFRALSAGGSPKHPSSAV